MIPTLLALLTLTSSAEDDYPNILLPELQEHIPPFRFNSSLPRMAAIIENPPSQTSFTYPLTILKAQTAPDKLYFQ